MLKDIHKDLGTRSRVSSIDEALSLVRIRWPDAYLEGSTGYQRSFWIRGESDDAELVAHCWEVGAREDAFWLRIKPR